MGCFIIADTVEKEKWLLTHCDPINEVEDAWKLSFVIRQKKLKEDKLTVKDYFSRYSPLRTQIGADLVSLILLSLRI